jgi:acetylornithine deacetylase/succinyl-diaminopimelate desuccinylase-like protein
VTAGYLERSAALQQGDLAADMKAFAANPKDAGAEQRLSQFPFVNGLLRTTCVATMLNGGHAANALPQLAQANVNCRILPGEDPKKIEAQLRELAGPKVQVEPVGPAREPAPLSKLRPELMQAVEKISAQMFPGAIVIPTMEIGATDGAYLRGAGIPTYGISGIFGDVDDVRAHGRDERIGIKDFYDGLEFNDRLVKALAGKP